MLFDTESKRCDERMRILILFNRTTTTRHGVVGKFNLAPIDFTHPASIVSQRGELFLLHWAVSVRREKTNAETARPSCKKIWLHLVIMID